MENQSTDRLELALGDGAEEAVVNNRLRGALDSALAGMDLLQGDAARQREAAAILQRGAFDDMPLTQIVADFQVVYPTMMREQAQMHAASFQQDVEREVSGG